MNPKALIALSVIALAVLIAVLWPKGPGTTSSVINVPPLVLEGKVQIPNQGKDLRIEAIVNGEVIASTKVQGDAYKLELPSTITTKLSPLETVRLPNGNGRLRSEKQALGANVALYAYQDSNNNDKNDTEELLTELDLFQADKPADYQGFFFYNLVILSDSAALQETQDTETGTKNFYHYDLNLDAGWHIIEGEIGTNGYEIRRSQSPRYNLLFRLNDENSHTDSVPQ